VLAGKVLGDAGLAADPGFATNLARVARRAETDGKVAALSRTFDAEELARRLDENDIAYARVNDVAAFARHPHLRRITIGTPSGLVSVPSPAARHGGAPRSYGPVPSLGEHSEKIRAEFAAAPVAGG